MHRLTLSDDGIRNDSMEWQICNDGDSPIPVGTVMCEWWVFDQNDITNFVVDTVTYRNDYEIDAGECARFGESLPGFITTDGLYTSSLQVGSDIRTYNFEINGGRATPIP